MNRRLGLQRIVQLLAVAATGPGPFSDFTERAARGAAHNAPFFSTRGIVLLPTDLGDVDWPGMTRRAGLSTIGIHGGPKGVAEFIETDTGRLFLSRCQDVGLEIEYELHAMRNLLPRELFERHPGMFRMNEDGDRVADANCCPASREGLEVICENAVRYAQTLHPTTHRYFYWLDDVAPTCHCPDCRGLSDSDQAVIVENAMLQAVRKSDPEASLSHLAYVGTLKAPRQVAPDPGLFLEFAPIERSWAHPLDDLSVVGRTGAGRVELSHGQTLDLLDENLEVFGSSSAQILEYWMDASLHSNWKRPGVSVPWAPEVLRSDLQTYARRGIRHITTFAAWIDAAYVERFGPPDFVADYGAAFQEVAVDGKDQD